MAGMAYTVNGQISTIDVYNSPLLFKKLYPKLLKTAAAEAAAEQRKKEKFTGVTASHVAAFIASAADGKKQERKLGYGNIYVRIFGRRSLMAQLYYVGEVVHTQVIATESKPVIPLKPGPRPRRPLPRGRPM